LLAEEAGTVLQLIGKPGDEMEVGSTIAVVGAPGESADLPAAEPEAPAAEVPAAPVAAPIATPVATPPAAPVAEAPAPAAASGRQSVSPIARKLAKDSNLDLSQITGTGPGGRIVKRDVLATAAAGIPAAPAAPAAPVPTSSSKELASQEYSSTYSTVPHTSMRKAIARRLTESKSTVPHFYLNADCQVDELLALRKKINESSPVKISVNDMVVRAVAAAFMDVPEANVVWTPDAMIKYESVDVSIAVSTDGGLLTPVLRGVEKRSLSNIATTIVDLAERSRAGKLRQEELEGGSFAITNLGMFGTTSFAAIINPPQSGILAVGAASQRPIVVDGELTIANVMSVTLSADHRAVDGALAAKWLAAFKMRIENPLTMLI
jgi:pyruvate dehydrogenase E2 component (dihydrolipoamide acetyltransferase)